MPEKEKGRFLRSLFSIRSQTINRKNKGKVSSTSNSNSQTKSQEPAVFFDADSAPVSKEEPIFGVSDTEIVEPSNHALLNLRRSSTTTFHRNCFATLPIPSRKLVPWSGKRIVFFTTSLRTIRRTYEDCRAVKTILRGLRIAIDERDLAMDASYRTELQDLLCGRQLILPQVFIGKKYLGGVEQIKQMHEDGELDKIFTKEGVVREPPGYICPFCNGLIFLPCSTCNGSRKVFDEDHQQMRRCYICNENGLVRCDECC